MRRRPPPPSLRLPARLFALTSERGKGDLTTNCYYWSVDPRVFAISGSPGNGRSLPTNTNPAGVIQLKWRRHRYWSRPTGINAARVVLLPQQRAFVRVRASLGWQHYSLCLPWMGYDKPITLQMFTQVMGGYSVYTVHSGPAVAQT